MDATVLAEGDGYWWVPGREDRKVAGHLRFDREGGGSLALVGALSFWTDYAEITVAEDAGAMQSP